MTNKANINHVHREYADKNHMHEDFYTKEEINQKLSEIQASESTGTGSLENYLTKAEAAEKFAPRMHTHTEFARLNHTHTGFAPAVHNHPEYANKGHTHQEYANKEHNHNEIYYTKEEVDQKVADVQSSGEVDLSDYYSKQETYNKTEIDEKVAGMSSGDGGSTIDLGNYYNKQESDQKFAEKKQYDSTTSLDYILNETNNDVSIYVNPFIVGVDNIKTHGLSEETPLSSIEYTLKQIPKNLNGRTVKIIICSSLNLTGDTIKLSGFVGGVIEISPYNETMKILELQISYCTRVIIDGYIINEEKSGENTTFIQTSEVEIKNCMIDGSFVAYDSRIVLSNCEFVSDTKTYSFVEIRQNSNLILSGCTASHSRFYIKAYSSTLRDAGDNNITVPEYATAYQGGQVLS